MLTALAVTTVSTAAAWWGYTYAGYPLVLSMLARRRAAYALPDSPAEWPMISICVPAHNEAASIGATLERLIAIDYPASRREIVVFSDASTDGTDDIVLKFAPYGVVLHRFPVRIGKTEGENAVAQSLRGDIIINTDASVVVDANAIKPLVRAFTDPDVGIASGRDISVARPAQAGAGATRDESSYVGYEMRVRNLETRVAGLVGASGCLYAARGSIQRTRLPGGLARDFASALIARERGLRSVSVDDAICYVPRSTSLHKEYHRKTRTITRGLATLMHFRHLLNPLRHGRFAFQLWSHKLARWLAPLWAIAGALAIFALAPSVPVMRIAAAGILAGALFALWGILWPDRPATGRIARLSVAAAFFVVANVAVVIAWLRLARGANPPMWEPTKRIAN